MQVNVVQSFDLAFESIVIIITLVHTWSHVRKQRNLNIQGAGGIVEAILRNGTPS